MRPTLSYDHPAWPEFCRRHEEHFFAGEAPDRFEPRVAASRCNARAHRDDNGEVPHAAGTAFSATIAILAALELDVPSSLEWLEDQGGRCDCTVGFNVIACDPDAGDEA